MILLFLLWGIFQTSYVFFWHFVLFWKEMVFNFKFVMIYKYVSILPVNKLCINKTWFPCTRSWSYFFPGSLLMLVLAATPCWHFLANSLIFIPNASRLSTSVTFLFPDLTDTVMVIGLTLPVFTISVLPVLTLKQFFMAWHTCSIASSHVTGLSVLQTTANVSLGFMSLKERLVNFPQNSHLLLPWVLIILKIFISDIFGYKFSYIRCLDYISFPKMYQSVQ